MNADGRKAMHLSPDGAMCGCSTGLRGYTTNQASPRGWQGNSPAIDGRGNGKYIPISFLLGVAGRKELLSQRRKERKVERANAVRPYGNWAKT